MVVEEINWQSRDLTPSSNTGSVSEVNYQQSLSEGLVVGVDYFRGTSWHVDTKGVQEVIGAWMALLGDEPVWEYDQGSYNGKQWAHRGHSIKGMKWWWNDPGDGQSQAHLLVSLSGKIMAQIDIKNFWKFCRDVLKPTNFKVTRLDIAIDDYLKRIDEGDVKAAAERGYFAIVKTISPYRTHKSNGVVEGFTWYFGSMKSDNFARFYDKDVESKGETPTYRLEGQFADEKAHLVWQQWLLIDEESFDEVSPQYLAGSVLGLVEFVDRNSGNGKKRREIRKQDRLSWWQQFIDACGAHIRHACPRPDTTLGRTMQWCEKQVLGTMAAIQKAIGILEFRRWLDEGLAQKAANFTREQAAKVSQWSKGESDVEQRTNGAADVIDEDGIKWVWVFRKGMIDPWFKARLLGTTNNSCRVRCSGESSQIVSRRLCHFGSGRPTWVPSMQT